MKGNRGWIRWAAVAFVLTAFRAAPAMGQGTFPGQTARYLPLSPDAKAFVYCGLDRPRPFVFEDLGLLVGDLDWVQWEADRATWGFGGAATQPDDVNDPADEAESNEGMRHWQIERTKASLQRALDSRPNDGQWRRMVSLLETHFYDVQELAVLEIYARRGQGGRYVLLGRTPRGCFAASDVGPWHVGALTWGKWDNTWRGQPTITTADPDATARFFQSVREADEPNVLLNGMVTHMESPPPLQAVLHVIWETRRWPRSDPDWRLALVDEDAWLSVWALGVDAPQLDPEAVALLGNPQYDSDKVISHRWQDVFLPETEADDYRRVRDHFTARLRHFWMTALPPARLTDQEFTRIVGKIAATEWVAGSAIGEGGDESAYWQLSQGLLRVLSREDFRKMLSHRDPKVRAMGLYCLAQIDPTGSVELLKARLGRRDRFTCIAFGCIGAGTTEGRFALRLLHNARYLDQTSDYAPLLSRPAQLGLDLAVLARDECASSHWLAGNALSWALHEDEFDLTWSGLRELGPALSDAELVKALGRIRPEPTVRAFLLATLSDASLDAPVRLAAGSALTRDADSAALEALIAAEAGLNELADGAGTECARLARGRATMAAKLSLYESLDRHKDSEWARVGNELVELYADCPVGALAEYESNAFVFDWAVDRVDLNSPALAKWQQAVLNLSGRLSELEQPWNTYSDLPWRLDLLLAGQWAPGDDDSAWGFFDDVPKPGADEEDIAYGGRLGRENWDRVRENVTVYLEQREATP